MYSVVPAKQQYVQRLLLVDNRQKNLLAISNRPKYVDDVGVYIILNQFTIK